MRKYSSLLSVIGLVIVIVWALFVIAVRTDSQTHTFPALDTDNTFTGANTFDEPITTTADGVHPSDIQMVGNTTLPTLGSNIFHILGPSSATFTSWSLQAGTGIPTTTHLVSCVVTGTNCVLTDSGLVGSSGSLVATGIVDGLAPVNDTTTTACTLGTAATNCGSLNFLSGYTMNQEGTAGTAVTYTLPATAAGKSYCVRNSIVSGTGAADTGIITVYPPASSYVILNGTRNTVGGGGTHGVASAGAAGDSACFIAIDATDWEVYVQRGTWAAN